MRVLIIGGTKFVGRHITEAALAAGHEVTLLHRGRTGADLFPQSTHLLADRDGDLSALAEGDWDVTFDVSAYLPRQVTSLAQALGGRGGHYVYISSVSAYDIPAAAHFTEDSPLLSLDDPFDVTEVTDENYGPLKAECERAALSSFGSQILIVRPTYVVGPHDSSYRFTYWVERVARGGEVLAPGNGDAPIQLIDARDQATWLVGMAQAKASGAFHTVGPATPISFRDMLEAIVAEVGPPGTRLSWIGSEVLRDNGITDELPLWTFVDPTSILDTADPAAAYAAGLSPRPLRQTIREIHEQEQREPTPQRDSFLTAQRESELLRARPG